MPRDYMAKKGINGYTWYRLLGTALRCKPNLLNRVLNDESWLTGLDDGRGVEETLYQLKKSKIISKILNILIWIIQKDKKTKKTIRKQIYGFPGI